MILPATSECRGRKLSQLGPLGKSGGFSLAKGCRIRGAGAGLGVGHVPFQSPKEMIQQQTKASMENRRTHK